MPVLPGCCKLPAFPECLRGHGGLAQGPATRSQAKLSCLAYEKCECGAGTGDARPVFRAMYGAGNRGKADAVPV